MKSICVFCGSAIGSNSIYIETVHRLGALFAQRQIRLVYGGGNIGLMGVIADACLDAGGEVLGIIPGFLKEKEVCHTGLTELIVTRTMHERKQIMEERSGGVIVLPGGFGTLDEFFEILTWKQLHLHQKPIGLLNVNGYYDALLAHIRRMAEEGFLRRENLSLMTVAEDMEVLLEKMTAPANPSPDKWL
jgi:uncharacterized protein (TIGR00730 family)